MCVNLQGGQKKHNVLVSCFFISPTAPFRSRPQVRKPLPMKRPASPPLPRGWESRYTAEGERCAPPIMYFIFIYLSCIFYHFLSCVLFYYFLLSFFCAPPIMFYFLFFIFDIYHVFIGNKGLSVKCLQLQILLYTFLLNLSSVIFRVDFKIHILVGFRFYLFELL